MLPNSNNLFSIGIFLFLLLISSACEEQKAAVSPPPPPEVEVALPLMKTITEWDEYTGRFEAVEHVDIRSRVTGYLEKITFKDGQIVKKGDLLFVIDPRPFKYALDRAQTQYSLAHKEFTRGENLVKTNAISAENFDRRRQVLKLALVTLNEAKLNLEFTQITAPIDGKVSEDFISVGNLVRENDTLLTRIVSVDPIHFEFETSQSQLLKYIRLDRAGKRPGSDTNPNPIYIKLQDEKEYLHLGRMDFVDNIVDSSTGTILGRALVPNPDAIIYPGLFGRARVIGSGEYEALLLPQKAINTDQSRKYVYVVNEENKAKRVYLELGPIWDNGLYIVRSGLVGNERVVISGIQRIRATDQPVTPIEGTIEVAEMAPQTLNP